MTTLFRLRAETEPGRCMARKCAAAALFDYSGDPWGSRAPVRVALCAVHADRARAFGGHEATSVVDVHALDPEPYMDLAAARADQKETEERELAEASRDAEATLVYARDFAIAGQADLDFVAEVLGDVKTRAKWLEEREREITRPMNEALKKTRALFKPARAALAEVELVLKGKVADWRERELAANAAALAAGDPSRVGHVANADNLSAYERWGFEVVDAHKVPREFCEPSPSLIRQHMVDVARMDMAPSVAGVRFFRRTVVAARAR